MGDVERTNLCETCRKELECFQQGIFERESCEGYDPLPMNELLERDKFLRAVMVGPCPKCDSNNTYDCANNPQLEDELIGHCLDCETYWCIECGYIFEKAGRPKECPHWQICEQCSQEHGYLDVGEFVEKICATCEHFDNGCQLEDPSQCETQWQYRCPYDADVSECPEIDNFLSRKG
ncbi:MAG: hypothetical protein ACLFPU_09080 [Dehalococcoidia bacterium]